jgi:hypothetical protein
MEEQTIDEAKKERQPTNVSKLFKFVGPYNAVEPLIFSDLH